ncbi:hypothetical protein A8924_0713 [Saccharopolyspora erythraea NRRL 2338]|uniref:Uncharacterized protein n=1 Tax=Saccharopolyspora erythraea (strain ATCC 11635 / DSM 40517 / JCM 4748 / NBRC 13426 / NCIMB 8594 / NRRL 2338) TaxID=405948 RepID=A4F6J3_SACEN|nr:hypothetical protein [Saccharopolyspora erythraea]EQD85434.1 hypothetical protein N599_15010 [Saccharopolyspora erythraea D]PFG93470.1 hypothetical protein A8924_0713 [Saccharopolyspora erythraea NRRL 2338]QRK90337.1 hypothetical protein JQX30_02075 [Saccharopolyspora erythraea]CAL99667.1 hypothetical protein SACE_0318 [Saccharopolyspora erythraea NRRL 2338]
METWRIVATALITAVGGFMVLGIMSTVRARRDRAPGEVGRVALHGGLVVVVLAALAATVLPPAVCWGLVAAGVLITVGVMITG